MPILVIAIADAVATRGLADESLGSITACAVGIVNLSRTDGGLRNAVQRIAGVCSGDAARISL